VNQPLLDHVFNAIIGVDGQDWVKEQREQARRLKNPAGFLLYEAITRAKALAAYHSQQLELLLAKQQKTRSEYGREALLLWSSQVIPKIVIGLPRLTQDTVRFPIFRQALVEVARLTAVDVDSLERLTSGMQGSEDQAESHRRQIIATAALSRTWAGRIQ